MEDNVECSNDNEPDFFESLGKALNCSSKKYKTTELKEEESKKEIKTISKQWSKYGDSYIVVGDTQKTLPSGHYKIETSNSSIIYTPMNVITDDIIIFDDLKSKFVYEEIKKFWKLEKVFTKYGFSHKRGFILWGPPGSGKTICVNIVSDYMIKNDGIVIFADHPTLLAQAIKDLRRVEPDRKLLIVWEDFDSIIDSYGESSVLSVLDGELQINNVIFLATTNYPEKLDKRIVNRPSRFDNIVYIGPPSANTRREYLKKKFKVEELVVDGIDLVKESEGFSFAHLKEIVVSILCLKNPAKEVIDKLKKMNKSSISSNQYGNKLGMGIQ